ncbi:MAG: hypothetical protein HQL53_02920 [Magnetococcales bacterium]|nr:hypothetical protein [Magnetococcales bacterium]
MMRTLLTHMDLLEMVECLLSVKTSGQGDGRLGDQDETPECRLAQGVWESSGWAGLPADLLEGAGMAPEGAPWMAGASWGGEMKRCAHDEPRNQGGVGLFLNSLAVHMVPAAVANGDFCGERADSGLWACGVDEVGSAVCGVYRPSGLDLLGKVIRRRPGEVVVLGGDGRISEEGFNDPAWRRSGECLDAPPCNRNVDLCAGAASDVWKTQDGGVVWMLCQDGEPLRDGFDQVCGDRAAESDGSLVWRDRAAESDGSLVYRDRAAESDGSTVWGRSAESDGPLGWGWADPAVDRPLRYGWRMNGAGPTPQELGPHATDGVVATTLRQEMFCLEESACDVRPEKEYVWRRVREDECGWTYGASRSPRMAALLSHLPGGTLQPWLSEWRIDGAQLHHGEVSSRIGSGWFWMDRVADPNDPGRIVMFAAVGCVQDGHGGQMRKYRISVEDYSAKPRMGGCRKRQVDGVDRCCEGHRMVVNIGAEPARRVNGSKQVMDGRPGWMLGVMAWNGLPWMGLVHGWIDHSVAVTRVRVGPLQRSTHLRPRKGASIGMDCVTGGLNHGSVY